MTEEEYFRKHYPDYCYGDRLLSPYWDFFQDGVEFSERQSEKRIEELEQKLEQTEKDLADYQFNYPTIKELEKENTELKEQNRNYEQLIDNGSVTLAKERLKNYKQLIKAKEIIRTFLNMPMPNNEEVFADVGVFLTKAEQFLKEIEK